MKITVTDIEDALFGKQVRFKETLLKHSGDDFTTDAGTRAIRILTKLAGQHAMFGFLGDHEISVSYGNLGHFSSQAGLQRQIDRFANSRITFKFSEPTVKPLRSNRRLRTMQEVDAYNKRLVDGYLQVTQLVTFNLPVAHRDVVRVRRLLIDDVWKQTGTADCIGIRIQLKDGLLREDPWKLIASFHPQIMKLIV